ncbi:glycosyltransferase 87 family protein [Pseudoxanthomonas sp. J35]|uniref:glycosyltransferase 87 family protein n=1 Tax=Pseudoxanthomonas sp. J35 TaxID=935852 RepID=UPI00048B9474|nr:glycosyltransferase 87 family protein [Pseudoxanthomonas sp. J35]
MSLVDMRARRRGAQAACVRVFGFGSRAGMVRAAVAVALLGAVASLLRGQDANWDLRNYHLHNGWAWLHGRLGMDLAPAQLQTWFVPLMDVPYFLLVQHAPAPVAGALLGLVHGLAFLPVAWIGWRALAGDPRRDWLAPLLGLAGLASAAFLSELGTTMGDNTTAPLVLGALALCLPVAGRWRNGRTVLAGVLLGAAVGLKLTNALYAVALGLAVLAAPLPWRARLRTGVLLAGVALLVFAVLAGPWLHAVWQAYGNPLFPQYNTWFQAPLASPEATADLRWRPHGLGEALLRPLLFTAKPHLVSELALLQAIWAVLYIVAVLAAVAWLWRRLRGRAQVHAQGRDAAVLRMLGVFFVVGFVLWLWMFSIHRYLVVLELLAPLVLWWLLRTLLPGRAGSLVAGAAVLLCAVVALVGWNDWGHARWTREAFRVEAPAGPPPGLVLLAGDDPQSWRIPFLPKGPVYAGVATNFPESPAYAAQVRALVAAHDDVRVMLPAEADPSGGGKLMEKLERADRQNRWAGRLGLDRDDCPAMRWIVERSRNRGLLGSGESPTGRCRFVPLEGGKPLDPRATQALREAQDRERLAGMAATLEQRYGLHVDRDSCQVLRSWIGAKAFPYRLCRVGLVEAAG